MWCAHAWGTRFSFVFAGQMAQVQMILRKEQKPMKSEKSPNVDRAEGPRLKLLFLTGSSAARMLTLRKPTDTEAGSSICSPESNTGPHNTDKRSAKANRKLMEQTFFPPQRSAMGFALDILSISIHSTLFFFVTQHRSIKGWFTQDFCAAPRLSKLFPASLMEETLQ